MANTVRNTWCIPAKGDTRVVTVEIETTKPAGRREFDLMASLTSVVEQYMTDRTDGETA